MSVPYPELFWSRYTGLGSQTQTPKLSKVLIPGISFHHCSLSQSHESDVLSLFTMQNSQHFLGFCPWTRLGRAYSASQTKQLHNGFSPHHAHWKTDTPKKLLDTALNILNYFMFLLKWAIADMTRDNFNIIKTKYSLRFINNWQ